MSKDYESISSREAFLRILDDSDVSNGNSSASGPRLRIGFTGSQGTGKSTLAQEVARELNVPLLEEAARTVYELGFPLDREATVHIQTAIWLSQLANHLPNVHRSFVADRTYVDSIGYMSLLIEDNPNDLDEKYMNAMANVVRNLVLDHYDFVFHVPIEFVPADDGLRDFDTEWQARVDASILGWLHKLNIPYITVSGSVEERKHAVLSAIANRAPSND